jgi:hypothetical protein
MDVLKLCVANMMQVMVSIFPGSHSSEHAVNKQLNDKERVAAALENNHLLGVVNKCIAGTDTLSEKSIKVLSEAFGIEIGEMEIGKN